MQGRKQREAQSTELLKRATGYINDFGLTAIFESTSNKDLYYGSGKTSTVPDELYPYLVKVAEERAVKFQQEMCDASLEEDEDEHWTPEQKEVRAKFVANWRKMSPKEFWLMMLTQKREP